MQGLQLIQLTHVEFSGNWAPNTEGNFPTTSLTIDSASYLFFSSLRFACAGILLR